jgi:hypothetical protein
MNANTAKCEICATRPVPSLRVRDEAGMSRDMKYCVPCFEEANWENTHSDGAHEGFEALTVRKGGFKNKAELEAWKAEKREETKACWICHPELNEATREYTPREGTSREGMVVNVPIRAAASVKAIITAARVAGIESIESTEAKAIRQLRAQGLVIEVAKFGDAKLVCAKRGFVMEWDARGRFITGQLGDRKVRNVSELLRLISSEA